jgi:hypothetical protein
VLASLHHHVLGVERRRSRIPCDELPLGRARNHRSTGSLARWSSSSEICRVSPLARIPHRPYHRVRLNPGAVGEHGVPVADLGHRRPQAGVDTQLVQRRLDLRARARAELIPDHIRPVHQQHPAPGSKCGRGLQAGGSE